MTFGSWLEKVYVLKEVYDIFAKISLEMETANTSLPQEEVFLYLR